ncbi:hypothetical protein [Sutcliffiella deserti]|uniref:hypothetical protein n=1 Tax=Sutcliffiella deserti TaxID=2875501 RepID=UPI001CC10E6C|nr:hypothetical protein [Sutcliffiella deserti]
MKKSLTKKLEIRQALFKSHAEHRAKGHATRLITTHQRTQNNTQKILTREQ